MLFVVFSNAFAQSGHVGDERMGQPLSTGLQKSSKLSMLIVWRLKDVHLPQLSASW